MNCQSRFLNLFLLMLTAGFSSFVSAQVNPRPSTGLKPLIDLRTGMYQGYQGGLYLNGANERPLSHDSVGRSFAQLIKPLNSSGLLDPQNGRIVLLSIGMSNTTQEFSTFKPLAEKDSLKNPRLLIVDGAQGGQTAAAISNPSANFWTVIDQRLTTAGVTRQQVQVVWIKEADASPTQAFPVHARTLQAELEAIARIVKSRYPNCRLAYYSSRTYGGYASTNLNPEPYAYESGFAVRWVIEKQLQGDTSLSYAGPTPRAPWLAWGPYLWTDGITPRSDGLTWLSTDTNPSDGTHPSASGCSKVANLLLNFFKTDPTATPWFLRGTATAISAQTGVPQLRFSLAQNFPNPFNPLTVIGFQLGTTDMVTLDVFDLLGRRIARLVEMEMQAGRYTVPFRAASIPSGVYFYELRAGALRETRSMILTK